MFSNIRQVSSLLKKTTVLFLVAVAVITPIITYRLLSNYKTGLKSMASESNQNSTGNTYYVSPQGNNSNQGSQSAPWQTIQKAADALLPGDLVIVLPGDYSQERVKIYKSGLSGKPITFQAQGQVITKGFMLVNIVNNPYQRLPVNYIVIKGFEIANTDYARWDTLTSAGIYVQGSYNIIENNYLHDNSLNGIDLFGTPAEPNVTHNNIVRNNKLYRNEMVGISMAGQNNLIENNEIWETVQCHPNLETKEGKNCVNLSNADADGIRFFGQNNIISGNYIHDISFGEAGINPEVGDYNNDPHIDCFQTWTDANHEAASKTVLEKNICDNLESLSAGASGHGFMLSGDANNLTIKNNIIKAYGGINTSGGGNAHHLYIYNNLWINNLAFTNYYPVGIALDNADYSVVKNNIFYNQPYQTIRILNSNLGQIIDYNLAYNNNQSEPDCVRVNYACFNQAPVHNLWDVNPQFINPEKNDFHLTASSPAVNSGENLGLAVTDDLDDKPRPQGNDYDLGPYEFIVPPTNTPTPSPTPTPTITPSATPTATPTPTPLPTPTTKPLPTPTITPNSSACPLSPVAYWTFDQGAIDLTSQIQAGVYGASFINGKFGQALFFDGKKNYVDTNEPIDVSGDKISLEVRIKIGRLTNPAGIISKGGYWSGYRLLINNKNQVVFQLTGKKYSLTSKNTILLNSWNYVAVVYDGKQMRIYVNGVLDNNVLDRSGNMDKNTNNVWIGYGDNVVGKSWSYPFKGEIDEVAVYNRALSESEIKDHFFESLTTINFCQ